MLILYKYYKPTIIDNFQDSYISTKMIHAKRHIVLIKEDHQIYDDIFKDIPSKILHVRPTINADDANFILTNSYKFYIEKLNNKVTTITNMPNLCLFFSNNNKINTVTNINKDKYKISLIPEISQISDDVIIGYSHDYEKKIIEYILFAVDIDIIQKNIKFLKVSSKTIQDVLFVNNTIDIYFYCNTYNSPLLELLTNNEYTILNYNNIKMELLKQFIPFSRRKNIVINKKISENTINSNVILIDNLIYKNKIDNIINEEDIIQNMYNNKILNSYYSSFFSIHKIAEISNLNTSIFNIETFETKNINLKLTIDNKNIHIEDIPNTNKTILQSFYYKIYKTTDDDNVPFIENDTINIISSNKDFKGKFYVTNVRKDYITISRYALLYTININDKLTLSKADSNIDKIKPDTPLNLNDNDLLYIMGLNKEGIYIDNYIDVVNIPLIDYSNKYICFEDPTITTQLICESTKNIDGTSKDVYTWDRVCISNSECPYYLANKNYLNKRGGCISGYCELPIGVKRKSYRKYEINDKSFPICKGCIDKSPSECCKSQESNGKYITPDYVFPNENIEIIL